MAGAVSTILLRPPTGRRWLGLGALLLAAWHPGLLAAEQSAGDPADPLAELSDEERQGLEGIDLDTVVIKARRPTSAEQSTAFSETLEVKQAASRGADVKQVLSDAVGVQVRDLGGLGSYGVASIRGSTPNQVAVYLDGVLLNAGGFDQVNLGDLSLDLLERIQVYRGSTPAHLGSAGIGGALELTSRQIQGDSTEAAASLGSFETVRLFALRANRPDRRGLRSLAIVSLSGSGGGFAYFNDNGTEFNPQDDTRVTRQNNQHHSAAGLVKLDGSAGGIRWTAVESVLAKDQGLPGIDSVPALHAHLTTFRNALTARAELPVAAGVRLAPELSHLYLLEDFDDSAAAHGELGLGRQRVRTATHALGAGLLLEAQPAPDHYSTGRLDLRWEQVDQRELLGGTRAPAKQRLRGALALQHEFNPVADLFLLPAARGEWLHDSFGAAALPGDLGQNPAVESDALYWQASLGTRWQILEGLDLRANAGRYVRTPHLGELFGDRGAVVGNPLLRPEQGINADAGLAWLQAGAGALSSLRVEVAWFGTWSDDLIVYWQNSQDSVKPDNIDSAEILGLETSLRLVLWDLLGLSGNYTFLHTLNRSSAPFYAGRRLPGRPVHEVFGRIELGGEFSGWQASLWGELDFADHNFLDPANLKDAGARLLIGLGARVALPSRGWALTLTARNLLDTTSVVTRAGARRPLQDFEGFPLPGRTLLLSLHYTSDRAEGRNR